MDAESGKLAVQSSHIKSHALLKDISARYDITYPSQIEIDSASADIMFVSDRTLLSRIISNMLKNALEASESDEVVLIGCRLDDDQHICFWVQNNQFISFNARHQIFNRSFSTKGEGRGIGTYSMKLLAEKYLKGNVRFTTSSEKGTTFSLTVPLKLINGESDLRLDHKSHSDHQVSM